MAERQRITLEQVVEEEMAGEHADVLRESGRLVVGADEREGPDERERKLRHQGPGT